MISVIIPTFREALELPAALASLRGQSIPHDVLVVDAGSDDGTRAVAEDAGVVVLDCPRRQRGAQMNLGAARAVGDILLFLHADTCLAPGALEKIETALQRPDMVGGGFARRYDSASLVLRLTCLLAEARTRLFGWFLGDQAIFARKTTFLALGGFREWEAFEDLDFARRMARIGRVVTLRPAVISSARRFSQRGPAATTCRDLRLTAAHLFQKRPPATPSWKPEVFLA